jgi:hypothetical protein
MPASLAAHLTNFKFSIYIYLSVEPTSENQSTTPTMYVPMFTPMDYARPRRSRSTRSPPTQEDDGFIIVPNSVPLETLQRPSPPVRSSSPTPPPSYVESEDPKNDRKWNEPTRLATAHVVDSTRMPSQATAPFSTAADDGLSRSTSRTTDTLPAPVTARASRRKPSSVQLIGGPLAVIFLTGLVIYLIVAGPKQVEPKKRAIVQSPKPAPHPVHINPAPHHPLHPAAASAKRLMATTSDYAALERRDLKLSDQIAASVNGVREWRVDI